MPTPLIESLPLMPMTNMNNALHSGDYRFSLEVVQQPIRVRMCGFGDKDRRQITPPPCARLRIFHQHTGQEYLDVRAIDTSFYTVLVELWSVDCKTNLSLIDSSSQFGYHKQQNQDFQQKSEIMYTRNLIGSLAATAFKLHDLSDTLGIWFVLQDLSVRTEGEFRLKLSFVNLADSIRNTHFHTNHNNNNMRNFQSNSNYLNHQQPFPQSSQNHHMNVNINSAAVICSTFSDPFYSYSAKKFPGVIDSTALSKCFATQGVKISIRRENKHKKQQQQQT